MSTPFDDLVETYSQRARLGVYDTDWKFSIKNPWPKTNPYLEIDDSCENVMCTMTHEIITEVVEKQDEIIMHQIQVIGGEVYEKFTFDKNKVRDMLRKYNATRPKRTDAYPHRLYCPTCYHTLVFNEENQDSVRANLYLNNCPACGQTLDWKGEV